MSDLQKLDNLSDLIDAAKSVVFFTGAGISTESGIPDFRSPKTGIWNKISPIEFSEFLSSAAKRQESWQRKFNGDTKMTNARPNNGHLAIAKLVETGKAKAVITQNVDNLHQMSGIPSSNIIELHGNAHYASCLDCGRRFELPELKKEFDQLGYVENCGSCGGIIKTATISFGQAMPQDEMERAQQQTMHCDLFIVVGSSLVVYPAAGFPELAKRLGAKLAILNREPTPLDEVADLVLHAEIGPSLSYIVGLN